MSGDRLTRDLDEAMLGGVIAGVARHWDLDVTVLRLLALITLIPTGGFAAVLYVVAWMIVPRPDQVDESAEADRAEPRPLRERLRRSEVVTAAREAGDAARRAADRINDAARLASDAARTAADAARTAADAARTAAEELSDIAHQPPRRPPEDSSPSARSAAPTAPAEPPPPTASSSSGVASPGGAPAESSAAATADADDRPS